MLKDKDILNNKINFFKYIFYQNILKKDNKNYFLLDFFKGLKGSFFLVKKKEKKRNFYLYKSFYLYKKFNKFNNFDYIFNNLNINFFNFFDILKNLKKKSMYLVTLIEKKKFFFFSLKNIWLLQFFLNLKKIYIFFLNLKLFVNFNYLNNYYKYLKQNLIIKQNFIINNYFKYKFNIKKINFNLFFLYDLFIFFNYNELINGKSLLNLYYKYNNIKNINLLFINRIFRKLNKFFYYFKIFKNKKYKKKYYYFLIYFLKYFKKFNDYSINNILLGNIINKKLYFKYKVNNFFFIKKEYIQNNFVKLNFFINYLYKFYVNRFLNNKNEFNILLKYYFYFYNFIIKIFIKLLNNFKYIILNKYKCNNIIKKIIWIKIFLVYLYFRKILIYNIYNKSVNNKKIKYKRYINKIYYRNNLFKNKFITNKFYLYIKSLPQWRKKIVNKKLNFFFKKLRIRLILIKKIAYYKYGNYFFFLKLYKLKSLYKKIITKIKIMKSFKVKGNLKMFKLMKFIKNNKLKKKKVFNYIGLTLNKLKKFKLK